MATDFGFRAVSIPGKHCFVSYNRYDNAILAPIVKLINEQRPIWYDEGLIPGKEWELEIIQQINDSKIVVFFAGRGLFEREESYMYYEYRFATDYHKICICAWLDDMNDFNEQNLSQNMRELWNGLHTMPSADIYEKPTTEEKAAAVIDAMDKALRKDPQISGEPPQTQPQTEPEPLPKPEPKPEPTETANHGAGQAAQKAILKKLLGIAIPVALLATGALTIPRMLHTRIEEPETVSSQPVEEPVESEEIEEIQTEFFDEDELEVEYLEVDPNDVGIGKKIYFGRYEQDNDTTNGPEPIEWQIVDGFGNKIMLQSTAYLEWLPFDSSGRFLEPTAYNYVTWEQCTLRNWLNTEFYKEAFTVSEQNQIALTNLINYVSRDTRDKVFLFSFHDLYEYGNIPSVTTEYVKAKGMDFPEEWARDGNEEHIGRVITDFTHPDSSLVTDAEVDAYLDERALRGAFTLGEDKDTGHALPLGVRPCIWVNISF